MHCPGGIDLPVPYPKPLCCLSETVSPGGMKGKERWKKGEQAEESEVGQVQIKTGGYLFFAREGLRWVLWWCATGGVNNNKFFLGGWQRLFPLSPKVEKKWKWNK